MNVWTMRDSSLSWAFRTAWVPWLSLCWVPWQHFLETISKIYLFSSSNLITFYPQLKKKKKIVLLHYGKNRDFWVWTSTSISYEIHICRYRPWPPLQRREYFSSCYRSPFHLCQFPLLNLASYSFSPSYIVNLSCSTISLFKKLTTTTTAPGPWVCDRRGKGKSQRCRCDKCKRRAPTSSPPTFFSTLDTLLDCSLRHQCICPCSSHIKHGKIFLYMFPQFEYVGWICCHTRSF